MEDINCWESKLESCIYSDRLLNKLTQLNKLVKNPIDLREIKKACYYARKYHGPQMRQSGEPYYSHPLEVAYMTAEYTAINDPKFFRDDLLKVAILHDTIEDTDLTENMIAEIFDVKIAKQVEALTRVKPRGKISSAEMINLLTAQINKEALIIKFFDRFHNMQTLGVKAPEKAKKIMEETLIIFLTVAANIDYKLEEQLTKLCLNTLNLSVNKTRVFSNGSFRLPPPIF